MDDVELAGRRCTLRTSDRRLELTGTSVAVRKEGEHERAIITNETFLAERRSKWAIPPGTSTWKLSVRYGEVQSESPHAYLLKVPPVGRSNGHFTLEVRYDADIG